MTTFIGLNGVAQSGKDTVGAMLVERHGFERRAFADKLRDVAYGSDPYVSLFGAPVPRTASNHERLSSVVDRLGWDQAKQIPDVRRFLQRLGTEGVRNNLGQLTWIDAAFADTEGPAYVFTDCRFYNEVAAVHNRFGFIWEVIRPGVERANAHVSEQKLVGLDYTIVNDGTLEDLKLRVDSALLACRVGGA